MNANLKQSKKPEANDAALVHAFNAGQKDAFDLLVLRYKDRIFNLCIMYLGDYQEANDIAQEIFIKVFRSLGGFKFKAAFSTWLYRIAVNTCKNRIKSLEFRFKKRMRRLNHPKNSQANNSPAEIADESEDQGLVSPKWVKVPKFELTIEDEHKLTDARIEATEIVLEKLKKHKTHLSSQIEEQDDLPEILLKTEAKELSNPLQKYKKEVTTAVWWVCEKKMDENGFITTADIWDSIKRKIKKVKDDSLISDLFGSELGNSVQYDEDEFLKVELGYNKNTDVIKIVVDAVLIYQKREGVELKFTPDQLKLRVME